MSYADMKPTSLTYDFMPLFTSPRLVLNILGCFLQTVSHCMHAYVFTYL